MALTIRNLIELKRACAREASSCDYHLMMEKHSGKPNFSQICTSLLATVDSLVKGWRLGNCTSSRWARWSTEIILIVQRVTE